MALTSHDVGRQRARALSQAILTTLLFVSLTAVPLLDAYAGVGDVLCRAIGLLNGSIGRALCTAAIVAVGVGALFGKVSWGMATLVAVGVGALANAYSITILVLDLDPRQTCTD